MSNSEGSKEHLASRILWYLAGKAHVDPLSQKFPDVKAAASEIAHAFKCQRPQASRAMRSLDGAGHLEESLQESGLLNPCFRLTKKGFSEAERRWPLVRGVITVKLPPEFRTHESFYEAVAKSWFGEMPMTLIFDTAGNSAHIHKRPLTYEELASDVTALLPSS